MQLACLVRAEAQEHTPKSPRTPMSSMPGWRRRLVWGQVRERGRERERERERETHSERERAIIMMKPHATGYP